MKSSGRLLFFILLNVVISAATTLLVLTLWDRSYRSNLVDLPLNITLQPTVPSSYPTLPPLDKAVFKVENVFGVGDIQTEVVVLKRVGDGKVSLSGWRLQNEKGLVFQFPNLELNPGGAVQVFSGTGMDTPIELHWRQSTAIWRSGDTVRLFDSNNNLRVEYKIP